MVQVVCEKTGIPFDASSKRVKNHPAIMSILSEANRYGWYPQAMESLKAGRKAGYSTIEQFVNALRQAEAFYKQQTAEAHRAESERERQIAEVKRQRSILNEQLRGRGYIWTNLGSHDAEFADEYHESTRPDWHLKTPDGRLVTIRQAMEELAAQGVTFAKEWLSRKK